MRAAAGAAAPRLIVPDLPGGIPAVDVAEADRLRRDGPEAAARPLVVDVREIGEIVIARVPDAVFLPLSEFGRRFRELPTDRPLLLLCQSGSRSALATGHLVVNGYPAAANVAGGMVAWERAGLPTRRGPLAPGEGELPGR